jgi:ABC-type multidrug transport system ATPase subunit
MIVMQSIKNVSRNGRTVMVTIHQPSIDIFESFDALVLLHRGGKVSMRLISAHRNLLREWDHRCITSASA